MTDDNVVKFYPANAATSADNVLEQAIGKYEKVFLIGVGPEGDADFLATTTLARRDLLWLLEMFKANLILGEFDEED